MASLSFGKPTPQKVFLATLLALIFGVFLDKFGLLQYSVGFLVGIVFTLAAELLAIYYFVLKIEAKNEKRLNELRDGNKLFTAKASDDAKGQEATLPKDRARTSGMSYASGDGLNTRKKNLVEGNAVIQFLGKKKEQRLYWCFLRNNCLYYIKRRENVRENPPKIIPMNGAEVRRIDETEFKGMRYALEISHPEKRISYKIDYLFMIFDNEMDLERWYFGLLTVCTPRNGHVDWNLNIRLQERFQSFWNARESANWLNALWSRFHLNMRQSDSVVNKIMDRLSVRLGEKIEEKNLQEWVTDISIQGLELGSHPPTVENVMLMPPDVNGDLIIDCSLSYKNGDAKIGLSATVNLRKIAVIPIKMFVTLKALVGRLQIRIPPFPAQRFAISFYQEPAMDFEMDISMGEKASSLKSMILPKLKEIIIGRLKLMVIERFVAPHRKFIRIPTTPKSDPISEKELKVKVSTSVIPPPTPSLASASNSNPLSGSTELPMSPPRESPKARISPSTLASMLPKQYGRSDSDMVNMIEESVQSHRRSLSASWDADMAAELGNSVATDIKLSASSSIDIPGSRQRPVSFQPGQLSPGNLQVPPASSNANGGPSPSTSPEHDPAVGTIPEPGRLSQRFKAKVDRFKTKVFGFLDGKDDPQQQQLPTATYLGSPPER